MYKNLNNLIKRKQYQNFIKNGEVNMNYRISDKLSEMAKQMIENDEIKESLDIIKNQISFLDNDNIDNVTTLSNEDIEKYELDIKSINEGVDILNFKKQTIQNSVDENLKNMNIKEAVMLKNKLTEVDSQLNELHKQKDDLIEKINSSKRDFQVQIIKIREKYENTNILNEDFEDKEFASSVISQYKKERASMLVNQFLNSLNPEKQQEILENNQDLKGLVNVGENI